eukprot:COSAG01_NODE_4653_length_4846_cov_2.561197_7_plen_71_part_00
MISTRTRTHTWRARRRLIGAGRQAGRQAGAGLTLAAPQPLLVGVVVQLVRGRVRPRVQPPLGLPGEQALV